MTRDRSTCRCCGGTGSVPDAMGRMRPCSRCNDLQTWDAWAKKNCRATPPAEPATNSQQGTGK